jgi:predicted KAP-like P-loop ATPase
MLDPNSMNNTKLRRRRTKQNNSSFNSLNDIENNSVIERVQRKPNSFDRPDEFKQMDVGDDPFDFIPQDVISFRAMPDFVYKYINPNWIAGFGLVCMIGMVLQSCINAIQGH